jgi:hypothetical protein
MDQWYKCPQCNQELLYRTNPCPTCKSSLAWSQQGAVVYTPPINEKPPIVPQIPGVGMICANCGNSIIPVKSKFGCGLFVLLFILGIIPGLFYLIYYAGKRIDTCPICDKNAFIKEMPEIEDKPDPISTKTKIIVTASVVGFFVLIFVLYYMFKK